MKGFSLVWFFVSLSCVLNESSAAYGDSSQAKVRDYVLTGIREHRMKLQQGMFRANGIKKYESKVDGRLEGKVDIFCSFDFTAGLFRFDRAEPGMRASSRHDTKEQRKSWEEVQDGGKYVKTPTSTISYPEGSGAASILPSGRPSPAFIKPFDPRAVGLYTWANLEAGTSFEEIHSFLARQEYQSAVQDGPSVFRLECVSRGAIDIQYRLWIDEQRGFAPIRLEIRRSDMRKPAQWREPDVINEASWERRNDVWVPRTFRIRQVLRGFLSETYELAFQWESINSPQPPELFTKEGLDLKTGTYFMDARSGKPLVVGAAGMENFPKFGLEGPLPPEEERASLGWPKAVALISVVVVLSLYGLRVYWSSRKTRAMAD